MYKDVGVVLKTATESDGEGWVEIYIDCRRVYTIPLKYLYTMNHESINSQMSVVLGQALHKLIRKVNDNEQ